MKKLTKDKVRDIIEDFAREIEAAKRVGRVGPKPAKTVINFRNELQTGYERDICFVPIELLRYRKDNGRISSDVLHYEKNHGLLHEKDERSQEIIEGFLRKKDPEKTEELRRTILHEDQREPAIITCDGFLINGNRRKMVKKMLSEDSQYKGDPKFTTMKVVILPGKDDKESGGAPTLKEIEQIENRYQLQSDGKAEYSGFDRALSIKRKIECGISLTEQLRDDPVYAGIGRKEFEKAIKKFETEYLQPLECIDRYLELLGRSVLYRTVFAGASDRIGRWQAFLDYYKSVRRGLEDERQRVRLGVDENEVGKIEQAAFTIIRKRDLKGVAKVHQIMRDLQKWLCNKDSKKELLELANIDQYLPPEERVDENGKELDEQTIDKKWGAKHATEIIHRVKNAKYCYEHKEEREAPLALLQTALSKLNHDNMDTSAISVDEIDRAMELIRKIKERLQKLERELYHHQKQYKKLSTKCK